jgi:hypothetical protein
VRTIHRISYQRDDLVATTCGLVFFLDRKQAESAPYVTIYRGQQTCEDCPDESDLHTVIRNLIRGDPVAFLPMLPKQMDSLFDLLETYDCEEITLRRCGTVQMGGGHLQAQYILSLRHEGIEREWRDHALTRLFATAVTEISNSRVPADDRPQSLP